MTAKKVVTDDMLGRIALKNNEILRRVREGTLKGQDVLKELQAIIEGRYLWQPASIAYAAHLAYDLVVVEDVAPRLKLEASKIKVAPCTSSGYITGKELRKRAVERGSNLGLLDGKHLFEHKNEIPKSVHDSGSIVFPGTLLRNKQGESEIPVLIACLGGEWDLDFWRLDDDDDGGWGSRHLYVI